MDSTVAPAASTIANTMNIATIRLRRAESRPPAPPMPIMAGGYRRISLSGAGRRPPRRGSTPPQQGVQGRAGRRLPAHLFQPVDVEQCRDRCQPADAVQELGLLGTA